MVSSPEFHFGPLNVVVVVIVCCHKISLGEKVWWHVDDLSSAHVYLRQKPGETLNDISPDLLLDCASLVKANSIEGCKQSQVYVVYTRWKNLKKTSNMGKEEYGNSNKT